jgi:CRP/FNR family transcriptional regulator
MEEFLRGLQMLSGLSDQDVGLLARTAQERRFSTGERIVRRGDPGMAAFILKEGAAEALIEKTGSEPLRLSRILPGELFGELALFDDSPRSATVVAAVDCVVVEIRRDAFLQEVARNPETALRLLAVVAKRLRHAESVVSDFSDQIYGDVLPRLQQAVSAQLDSAKTICEESKKRADATIEQARHMQETADQHWINLVRIGSIVGLVVLGGGAVATFLGFDKIDDVAERTVARMSDTWEQQFASSLTEVEQLKDETERLKGESEAYVQGVKKDLKDLGVMRETALELDKMRRDLQLAGGAVAGVPKRISGESARDFVAARQKLVQHYLERPSRWESEILIEALDLLVGALERGYISVGPQEWDLIVDTVLQALRLPPDHWRQRLKLNEVTVKLYRYMVDAGYQPGARALIARMEDLLESGRQSPAAARVTATILAKFHSEVGSVRDELRKLLSSGSEWRRSQAAIDLISLGELDAWATLRTGLAGVFEAAPAGEGEQARKQRAEAAFAAAHLIAERSAAGDVPARKYFSVDALGRQLDAEALARHLQPWPTAAPVGVDLVARAILEGLTRDPTHWNRFYWQYSCDLLCDLGCRSPAGDGSGGWCKQCLDALQRQYAAAGIGVDRSAASCARG